MAHFDLSLEELQRYRPDVAEPPDFDEFWATTLTQARTAGGDVTLAPALSLPGVEVQDVTFPGYGGHPIRAWLSRPASVRADLPVIVEINGYGGGRGLAFEHTLWPAAGYAHLMMDTRGQGSGWGSGGDTPDPAGTGASAPGFMTRGIDSPERYYFRRLITDAVRAVDAVRTIDGIDPTATVIKGGSQGGGVAIAVAGLVPDLAACLTDVPFLCHIDRAIHLTDAYPYAEIVTYLATHRDITARTMHTLSYVDGVNHAKRATAPSLWSTALMDQICPPSTGYAAFNWYGHRGAPEVAKEMMVYPYNGHEGGGAHQSQRQLEWLTATVS